ncbi:MAG: hypothetical protein KAX52_00800, partial [Pseudomonas sp.]|nr:hypothetical protein [Pseudomonas sp.]
MLPTPDIQFPLPAGTVLPDYGTNGLYGLASSLRHWLHDRDAAWLPGEVSAGERAVVILLIVDGLGDRFLDTVGQGSALHGARRQ